jgi:hypothetical protein
MAHERTLVALFAHHSDARRAINRLLELGIRSEQIGYLEPLDIGQEKNAAKGAAEGVAAGATSGAIIGELLAVAAIGLIPGIGSAVVAGALAPALLAGPLTGAVSGAVVGGLVGADLESEEEPYFLQEVKAGRILVSVEVGNQDAEPAGVLRENSALEVASLGTATLHTRLRHPASRI